MNVSSTKPGAYLKWIVASNYYDGVMEGIGERTADGAAVWFRAVAWDDAQWQRVFAVATTSSSLTSELLRQIEKVEQPQSPFWLPGSSSAIPSVKNVWAEIQASVIRTQEWHLVEAHDLLEPAIEHAVPSTDRTRISEIVNSNEFFELSGCEMIEQFLRRISS